MKRTVPSRPLSVAVAIPTPLEPLVRFGPNPAAVAVVDVGVAVEPDPPAGDRPWEWCGWDDEEGDVLLIAFV